MRQEAVRAVDGLTDGRVDGWGIEQVVRRAVGPADGQRMAGGWPGGRRLPSAGAVARADARRDGHLRPTCGRVGGWQGGRVGRLPLVRTAICNTESTKLPHPLDGQAFTPG